MPGTPGEHEPKGAAPSSKREPFSSCKSKDEKGSRGTTLVDGRRARGGKPSTHAPDDGGESPKLLTSTPDPLTRSRRRPAFTSMLVKGIALLAVAGSFQPPEDGILLWSRAMGRAVFVIAYAREYSATNAPRDSATRPFSQPARKRIDAQLAKSP